MVSSVNRISVNKESTGERMPIQKKEHSCNWVENSTEKSKVKMSGIRQTFRPQIWVNTKWSISDDKTLFLLDTWVTPCFHICYLELYRHMHMCICMYIHTYIYSLRTYMSIRMTARCSMERIYIGHPMKIHPFYRNKFANIAKKSKYNHPDERANPWGINDSLSTSISRIDLWNM